MTRPNKRLGLSGRENYALYLLVRHGGSAPVSEGRSKVYGRAYIVIGRKDAEGLSDKGLAEFFAYRHRDNEPADWVRITDEGWAEVDNLRGRATANG